MRVLLVSHQLDFSGAPLALLQLARTILSIGHEVRLVALAAGPLGSQFAEAGVRPADFSSVAHNPYDVVIANTVLSIPVALRIAGGAQRVLPWIHESSYFFSLLRVNPESLGLHLVRRAAFPARFQLAEYGPWMGGADRVLLPNCVVMPPHESATHAASDVLVCCGRWEQRKGQERLLHLLQAASPKRRVLFLGATRPGHVQMPDLDFTGQVPPESARSRIADSAGLISAAESEVQPLSVIEALLAGRPVMLSDIPAHRELRELMPDLILFDAADSESFRRGLRKLDRQRGDRPLLEALQQCARTHFGFETFKRNVESLLGGYSR
ncbi:MAG: glycosyltransferase family 4 protein [Steroidobacteraceae bacterium]